MSSAIEDTINQTVLYLNKPFWKASEYILAKDCSWQGVAYKISGIALAILTVPFAIAGETLHFLSHAYYQRPYLTYVSSIQVNEGCPKKFLTFNACMMPGGLPILFGGMRPADQRLDNLADFLKRQNADIVCLQEMAFDPSTQLIDRIKDTYSYFHYRIGPNPYGMESALFWASKFPLKQEPQFIPFNIPGMQRGFRRGFFVAELEDMIVITTHLDPHTHRSQVRTKQIKVIIQYIREQNMTKPILLMGDLNIEIEDTKAHQLLKENFINFKEEDVVCPTSENATCYDNCPQKPPKWAVLDHILVKNQREWQIVERAIAFNLNNLSSALSDHHAVMLTL